MMIWTRPPPTFLQLFTKYPVFFLEGAPYIHTDRATTRGPGGPKNLLKTDRLWEMYFYRFPYSYLLIKTNSLHLDRTLGHVYKPSYRAQVSHHLPTGHLLIATSLICVLGCSCQYVSTLETQSWQLGLIKQPPDRKSLIKQLKMTITWVSNINALSGLRFRFKKSTQCFSRAGTAYFLAV